MYTLLAPHFVIVDDMVDIKEYSVHGDDIFIRLATSDIGQYWRLGGVALTVINASEPKERFGQNTTYGGFHYDFRVEDVLLGKGGDISMLEAKPSQLATELIVDSLSDLLSKGSLASDTGTHVNISKEESMKAAVVLAAFKPLAVGLKEGK